MFLVRINRIAVKTFIFFALLSLNTTSFASQICNSNSIADIAEKISPAIVNISVSVETRKKTSPFSEMSPSDEPLKTTYSSGLGFVIDNKGHVVTNNHVIENAQEINITIGADGKKVYKAKVIGKDKKTNLAVLRMNTEVPITFVSFGDSDRIRVGENIMVIGNPYGLRGTIISGIISAKGRYLGGSSYEELLQTNVSTNISSSGSPMFNMYGEVVGVTAAVLPSSSDIAVGFSIPSNTVKRVIDKLLKDGRIERPWLGIMFQPVTDNIVRGLALNSTNGVIVSDINNNSPAKKAGIQIGDIIVSFNGKQLNNANQFPIIVTNSLPNTTIPVEIIRQGKVINLNVLLEIPKNRSFNQNKENIAVERTCYGIGVVNLTKSIRDRYMIGNNVLGVLITRVHKNSDAYRQGLKAKDIIRSINNNKVTSSKQFRDLLTNIKLQSKKGNATAVMLVSRNGHNLYMSMELN